MRRRKPNVDVLDLLYDILSNAEDAQITWQTQNNYRLRIMEQSDLEEIKEVVDDWIEEYEG